MRRYAFTLAEVLITLTIIGVIAALTIPNLMQSWRKHERITQIKAAYSILNNMVKLSVAENGSTNTWDLSSNDHRLMEIVDTYYAPYLKLQYKCGRDIQQKERLRRNGCFLNNGKNGTWLDLKGITYDQEFSGYNSQYHYTMKLQNGMSLGILWGSQFIIDVNGDKGPSQLGNDVFCFDMNTTTGAVKTCGSWCSGTDRNKIKSCYNGGCEAKNGMAGLSCAKLIEMNGWEFPDDYPIKKF